MQDHLQLYHALDNLWEAIAYMRYLLMEFIRSSTVVSILYDMCKLRLIDESNIILRLCLVNSNLVSSSFFLITRSMTATITLTAVGLWIWINWLLHSRGCCNWRFFFFAFLSSLSAPLWPTSSQYFSLNHLVGWLEYGDTWWMTPLWSLRLWQISWNSTWNIFFCPLSWIHANLSSYHTDWSWRRSWLIKFRLLLLAYKPFNHRILIINGIIIYCQIRILQLYFILDTF